MWENYIIIGHEKVIEVFDINHSLSQSVQFIELIPFFYRGTYLIFDNSTLYIPGMRLYKFKL